MTKAGEVRVLEVIPRTYNVKSFRLEPLAGAPYSAGQFLCLRFKAGDESKRWLSISSSPTESGYIEFTKKITQSDFSCALDRVKAGEGLYVEYPFGKFTLRPGVRKLAFLSGGIGITPIRSMCKFAVDSGMDVDIGLIYANRSVRDIVFKDDFDHMAQRRGNLRVEHVLCEADPGFNCTVGRIDAGIIRDLIPDFAQRIFYLCGPPPMVAAMEKILKEELGLPQAQVVTENFTGY